VRHGGREGQHRFRVRGADRPGKAKLLESIRDTGSISAAAREMSMSY
jgi:molybdenum-dependent DNA-binding transcriptional regulator ModE